MQKSLVAEDECQVVRLLCVVTEQNLHSSVFLKRVLVSFQLRSGGSQILEGCIAEIPNISSLDVSDNGGTAALFMNFNEGPVCSVFE